MYRFQSQLPRLPVPELSETCALYLRMVRPLLGDADFAATERAVEEFLGPRGGGEVLQARLLRWRDTPGVDNWLERFWDDWYLLDDTPLLINVSPGLALSGGPCPQIPRAARLLAAALRFKALVDREELEPDLIRGIPQCMSEYPRLLASTRIPGATRDHLERCPDSRTVVVVRNNRFFELEVLDESSRPFGVERFEQALRKIVAEADAADPGVPVGVLTTENRRVWARLRDELLVHGPAPNPQSLASLERAILVLVLERGTPPASPRSNEAAHLFLHGDGRSRWFDKSMQLIVAENGISGICIEHAGFDGSTSHRFVQFLVENEDAPSAGTNGSPAVRELRFEPTQPLRDAIARAEVSANALMRRVDVEVLDIQAFGKREIASRGVSPDGFVQIAFQLAYFRLTGRQASTYEAVSIKHFLHGRTEAMRSVSTESVAFVRAPGEATLRNAISSHIATVALCKQGRGVDRHLLGLRQMIEAGDPLPALFADTGYAALSRSILSTSTVGSTPGTELACFGPVVDEGFGFSYAIHDGSVLCVVTNFHGLVEAFARCLEQSLVEMFGDVSSSNDRLSIRNREAD